MELKLSTWVTVRRGDQVLYSGPNYITAAGRTRIAALVIGDSTTVPSYMAIGDGSAVTTDAMSALAGNQHERVLAIVNRQDNVLTWLAQFGVGIGSSETVREVAIFDAAVSGLMLCRIRPADFIIVPADVIDISWELRFGDSV